MKEIKLELSVKDRSGKGRFSIDDITKEMFTTLSSKINYDLGENYKLSMIHFTDTVKEKAYVNNVEGVKFLLTKENKLVGEVTREFHNETPKVGVLRDAIRILLDKHNVSLHGRALTGLTFEDIHTGEKVTGIFDQEESDDDFNSLNTLETSGRGKTTTSIKSKEIKKRKKSLFDKILGFFR